jgi:hypothetical protein
VDFFGEINARLCDFKSFYFNIKLVCCCFTWEMTHRTSPSSGQAVIISQLSRPKHLACHSRAALEGLDT